MASTLFEKLEKAAGIGGETYEMPYNLKKKERIKSNTKARPWTGPRPWQKMLETMKRNGEEE